MLRPRRILVTALLGPYVVGCALLLVLAGDRPDASTLIGIGVTVGVLVAEAFASTKTYLKRVPIARDNLLVSMGISVLYVLPLLDRTVLRSFMLPSGLLLAAAVIGVALCVVGTILRCDARRALTKRFTVRAELIEAHTLETAGPYRLLRHPGYLGTLLILIGGGIVLGSGVGALVVLALAPYGLRRIRCEEQLLHSAFGERYDVYKSATPMLVPRFSSLSRR
jgi:protein-S-isoprenylcysteine O-methyltransferase Ste14